MKYDSGGHRQNANPWSNIGNPNLKMHIACSRWRDVSAAIIFYVHLLPNECSFWKGFWLYTFLSSRIIMSLLFFLRAILSRIRLYQSVIQTRSRSFTFYCCSFIIENYLRHLLYIYFLLRHCNWYCNCPFYLSFIFAN